MPYLESFTEEQRSLLVSLPYRAGLWVSESDEDGGDDADEAEMHALECIITGYSEDFLKSEFVEEVMLETLAHKDRWKDWSAGLDNVPEQCARAVDALNQHMESKEVLSFRQTLMDIARAVAMAYREFDEDEALPDKIKKYSRYYCGRFSAYLKKEQPPTLDEVLNISKAEQATLVALSKALQLDLEGNPVDGSAAAA